MPNSPALVLKDITKSFSGNTVLNGINCRFERGSIHCLLGENGAGKSTLIKIISGAYQADSGQVEIGGVHHGNYGPLWARSHGINTIYQEIDLIPNLTVWENVVLGAEPKNLFGFVKRKLARERVADILDKMDMAIDPMTVVGTLSLAKQQMVAIAKAMVINASIIILDEPTAVFTRRETETLFRLMRKLANEKKSIIFISHHLDEVFEIGDWITVLRDGNQVSTGPIADYDHDRVVHEIVGRDIDLQDRSASAQAGDVVLKTHALSDGKAVEKIDLELRSGEILCLAGLVGSGRSETARMLVGASQPVSGHMELAGKPYAPASPANALECGIVYMPEDRKTEGLALGRSAEENLLASFIQKRPGIGRTSQKLAHSLAAAQMSTLEVDPPDLSKSVRYFSGGNQQKLVLGRILLVEPQILILDEPTRGVDVGARSRIYQTIRELRDAGKAILIVSSNLEEVLSISDRILVMKNGCVSGELPARDATEEDIMRLAYSVAENPVKTI